MVKTVATPILRDLHIFALAATTQNLSATAEAVGMTPAAISKSIKRLEKVFGAKMFDRAGRGLSLTAAGQVVYKRSKSVDDLIGLVHTEVADVNAASVGLVRLGVSPAMIATVAAPAVAKLVSSAPSIQIEVNAQTSALLLEDLQAGALDMAIAIVPPKIPTDLRFDKLGIAHNFIVARRGHPVLRRPFTLEDLSRQKWIGAPPDVQSVSSFFVAAGVAPPQFSVKMNVSAAVFASVLANSDLLSTMDVSLLDPKLAASLTILPAPAPTRDMQFGLFWRRRASFSPAMKRCRIELMRAYRKR